MNNKANSKFILLSRKVFTPLRDLPTRITETVNHPLNSTTAFAENLTVYIIRVGRSWKGVKTLFWITEKKNTNNSFVI